MDQVSPLSHSGQVGLQRSRIATLDAIRGICAIVVMLMHCEFLIGINLAPSAYLAVDMFFLMSGFVLGAAYDDRLRHGDFALSFLQRRVGRLWPMWAIGVMVGATMPFLLAHRSGYGNFIFAYVLSMLLLPQPTGNFIFPLNTPGWSLFFEAAANIVYAVFAPRLSLRALCVVVVITGLSLVAAAFSHGSLYGGQELSSLYVGLARVSFSFFLGLTIYKAPRGTAFAGPTPFVLAIGALTAAFFVAPGERLRPLYDCVIVVAGCPALLLIAIKTSLARPWPAETLGALSYPLYTVHFPIMMLASSLHGLLLGWNDRFLPTVWAMALMAGLLVLALWLGLRVDPWIQNLFGRLLRGRPVTVSQPHGLP